MAGSHNTRFGVDAGLEVASGATCIARVTILIHKAKVLSLLLAILLTETVGAVDGLEI
jgi:hypothetical protein